MSIPLSKRRQEQLLDRLISWCDRPASLWLAGRSGVHVRRINKEEATDHIEQRIAAHYAAHPFGGALLTREAKIFQKYHFRQKIQTLGKKAEAGDPDDPRTENYRELVDYFREQYAILSEIDDPKGIARHLSRYYAEDMIAEFSPAFFRLFRQFTNIIFRNFSRSIRVVDAEQSFGRLAPLLGNEPVFYVPNHVSNADHVPVCLAIHRSGQSQPLIAAGANLYRGASAKVMPLLNAYKIRREYIGGGNGLLQTRWFQNPLYRRVHTEYLRYAWDQNEPCMFYIEGTRSRTGLIGEPKLGIINEIKRYLQITGRRAHFVPVSLSYSIVPEDVEIEAARQGQNISNKDLVAQLMELDRGYGEHGEAPIRLRFGAPLTVNGEMHVKEFSEELVRKIRAGLVPTCTTLLASGIEACHPGQTRPRFEPEQVRRHLELRHGEGDGVAAFDEALQIFQERGFIEPADDGTRMQVTRPEMIRQYANRLR